MAVLLSNHHPHTRLGYVAVPHFDVSAQPLPLAVGVAGPGAPLALLVRRLALLQLRGMGYVCDYIILYYIILYYIILYERDDDA